MSRTRLFVCMQCLSVLRGRGEGGGDKGGGKGND